jgi:N-acetylglucosamine kinase-like BadF-type ATPase
MDYIIGVDAGGTKTEAAAYNLEEQKIATGLSGPGNPAVNPDRAKVNIKEAISQCILHVKAQGIEGMCRCIFLGAAGIEVGENKKVLESYLREAFQCEVVSLHDSELAHAAILKGKDGIIIIAGTGSVCYGRYKGRTDKTGGWGHVLGDEGSGYWIALEALKRMTVEQDSGFMVSELSLKIIAHLEVRDVDGMKEFVHNAGKNAIADVAVVVTELARDGNSIALDILDRAGFALALMTERLYKKMDIYGPIDIGLSGGILCNSEQVREQLCKYLEKNLSEIRILAEDISPTKGACYLYKNNIKSRLIKSS